jgi:hypothetical protein
MLTIRLHLWNAEFLEAFFEFLHPSLVLVFISCIYYKPTLFLDKPYSLKRSVFWNIALRNPLKVNLCFGRICRLYLEGMGSLYVEECYVGFEIFRAVVIKRSVFWDITPCRPLNVNRRFSGTCPLWWWRPVPPKRRFTFSVIVQKTI